jgi:Nucleoporin complex subunit 54
MNASALQEEHRLRVHFEKLYRAYTGTLEVPSDSGEPSKFVAIVYNELSPEQVQQRFLSGIGNTGQIPSPPRPLQVSEKEWVRAVIDNPDPTRYVPQPIIGAVALQSRVTWQQERSREYASHAKAVQANLDFIRRRVARAEQELHEKDCKYMALQQKLLQVMTKVELARCFNKTLQPDEYRASKRLVASLHQVEEMRAELASLQIKARSQIAALAQQGASGTAVPAHGMSKEMKHELLRVLSEQRQKLERTAKMAKGDLADMALIHERVVATVPAATH